MIVEDFGLGQFADGEDGSQRPPVLPDICVELSACFADVLNTILTAYPVKENFYDVLSNFLVVSFLLRLPVLVLRKLLENPGKHHLSRPDRAAPI